MADRTSEMVQEQQAESLKQLQVDAGLVPKRNQERLDWMYEFSGQNDDPAALLNQQEEESWMQPDTTKLRQFADEDSLRRLREDPLFLIKQAEQQQKKDYFNNPLVVEKLKKQKKDEKKHKKEKKHKNHRDNSRKRSRSNSKKKEMTNFGPDEKLVLIRQQEQLNQRNSIKKRNPLSNEEQEEARNNMLRNGEDHERKKDNRLSELAVKDKKLEDEEAAHRMSGKRGQFEKLNKQVYHLCNHVYKLYIHICKYEQVYGGSMTMEDRLKRTRSRLQKGLDNELDSGG
eukprot:GHVL01017149.1.p1 GENE.GHVL01017149.1~~GHVL01017149.1.p1  ORF type:complete len:286 (-),score=77.29 GHVL01017149.1:228-1085(-)